LPAPQPPASLPPPTSCAIRGRTGAKFHPAQPPMGPVGSWDGLEVVQGVQLGHRATWFGGGRARPASAPAPLSLPPPRTSGWRPAGKAVRLFGPPALAADASTSHGSGCYTASSFCQKPEWRRSLNFDEELHRDDHSGSQQTPTPADRPVAADASTSHGKYVTSRCPGSADRVCQ
jgi:hypothetical protein